MKTNEIETTPQPGMTDIGLATNTESRCACPILVDTSSSMKGAPIDELNAGLLELKSKLLEDPLACSRVELALISFNSSVKVEVDFCSPEHFNPPPLIASGRTMLGEAVLKGLEILNKRTAEYRAAGTSYYKPWMICITDGMSGDDISEAARLVREAETKRRLSFFGIGVLGADMEQLAKVSLRPPLLLDGLKFQQIFEWLSVGLSSAAASRPGDQVPLTQPNWAAV
jgi:uncharacterized protein YegL